MPKTKKPPKDIVIDFCSLLGCYGFTTVHCCYDGDEPFDFEVVTTEFVSGVAPLESTTSSWNFKAQYIDGDKAVIPQKHYNEFMAAIKQLVPREEASDAGEFGDIAIDIRNKTIVINHHRRMIEHVSTVVTI